MPFIYKKAAFLLDLPSAKVYCLVRAYDSAALNYKVNSDN
jgi:thioester reductase-like protein